MTTDEFNAILDRRIDQIHAVLARKGQEYGAGDRLHNFKRSAELRGSMASDTLLGMLVKHWVSIEDMVRGHLGGLAIPIELIEEKIGDAVNYLILLEAVLKEQS